MSADLATHAALPGGARTFSLDLRPGLGDCVPTGRIRLDALARWLQDVAYADVEDAGLAADAFWVVRRNRVTITRWPRFAEWFRLTTFCAGLGRMWALRRTTIEDARGSAIESSALWVHLDPESRRPFPFTERELAAYGPPPEVTATRISAKLRHPAPPPDAAVSPWSFRAIDCDIAGHVNNAAYWQPIEERLLGGGVRPAGLAGLAVGAEPAGLDAEIEFRAGAQPGEKLVLAQGEMHWLLDPDRTLLASVRLARTDVENVAEGSPNNR